MKINFQDYQNIVVLTGAGVSVASGLSPYRGLGGVWEDHDVEKFSNADVVEKHPKEMWKLFGTMRGKVSNASPNPAHIALARFEASLSPHQHFILVTQNVDGLHYRAGSLNVAEIHGNIAETRCSRDSCNLVPFQDDQAYVDELPSCPHCGAVLRPNIVLFGETLPLDVSWRVKQALRQCDLFLAVGTSGVVEPAASYVRSADYSGARTIYINTDPMQPSNPYFHDHCLGRAEDILPQLFGLPV